MGSSIYIPQKSTDPFARRAEQEARRDAVAKARVQAEADSIEEKTLSPTLAENVFELCNVLTSLLNREGAPHVKLYQVIYPGMNLPNDARAHLLALGKRLDLTVEVARYGKGKLSLSLV